MMRWAAITCLIVAAGATASARQVSAEAKGAFDRGKAAHNAGKTDEAVSFFERAVALDSTSSLYRVTNRLRRRSRRSSSASSSGTSRQSGSCRRAVPAD